jgi:hypothetical protein
MAELFIAKELHMSLGDLREKMTIEELHLWHAYIVLQRQEQQEATRRANRGRY